METKIEFLKQLKGKTPILVCGLPGISYVGKLSVDYLIQELKAELFAEVYSGFFPPYVMIRKDGIVEMLKNELYHFNGETEKGILFFTGNTQAFSPEGQYYIADQVLDEAIRLGVKRVYSIAAYLTNRTFDVPSVYGAATTPPLIEEIKRHSVVAMDQGSVGGTNGLIFGLAKLKKLEGICLLGETRGYQTPTGQYLVDAKAVRAVLEILTKMLNLKIDMGPLDKETKRMDDFITKIAEIERRAKEEMGETVERGRTGYIT